MEAISYREYAHGQYIIGIAHGSVRDENTNIMPTHAKTANKLWLPCIIFQNKMYIQSEQWITMAPMQLKSWREQAYKKYTTQNIPQKKIQQKLYHKKYTTTNIQEKKILQRIYNKKYTTKNMPNKIYSKTYTAKSIQQKIYQISKSLGVWGILYTPQTYHILSFHLKWNMKRHNYLHKLTVNSIFCQIGGPF